jgi:hypothetical protein
MPKEKEIDVLKEWDKLSRDIRIELFSELEKVFVRGFDDFRNCWCIDIDEYMEIKKRFLE